MKIIKKKEKKEKEGRRSIFRVIKITLHILPSGEQYKSEIDSVKCAIPTAE
jgi:hypothetical protein